MIVVEFKRTLCPHCGHPETRIVEIWRPVTCTMRKHVCKKCAGEFCSRDRFVGKGKK